MATPPGPWAPYVEAMLACADGERDVMLVAYDDFERDELSIAFFFRGPDQFNPYEKEALALCRGRVLDVGAGSGCLTLVLQERGLPVVALEVAPELVEILRRRGVTDARQAFLLDFSGERFDTVLIMMNGWGLAETLAGLRRMLAHLHTLVAPGGQVLADSTDVRTRPRIRPVAPGRYPGELTFELEFKGRKGAPFHQLYVDAETLESYARQAGWRCDVVGRYEYGQYLSRLTAAG